MKNNTTNTAKTTVVGCETMTVVGYEVPPMGASSTIPDSQPTGKGTLRPARRSRVRHRPATQHHMVVMTGTAFLLGLLLALLVVRHLHPEFQETIPGIYRLVDHVVHLIDLVCEYGAKVIEKIARNPKVAEVVENVGEFLNGLVD